MRDSLSDPIEIVPYDSAWPAAFEAEAERLSVELGAAVERIDHIGSTAIPGLAAKPVIDILLAVRSPVNMHEVKTSLCS